MTKCAWRPDEGESKCAESAADNKYDLCELHLDEMMRRAKMRRETFKVAAMESNQKRYGIAVGLHAADNAGRNALLQFVAEGGDWLGPKRVLVGHSKSNSTFFNYVTGNVKSNQVPLPGWEIAKFTKGVEYTPISGLSLEAARKYADAYNTALTAHDVADTTAIVA
jgi:hypothetical protein